MFEGTAASIGMVGVGAVQQITLRPCTVELAQDKGTAIPVQP